MFPAPAFTAPTPLPIAALPNLRRAQSPQRPAARPYVPKAVLDTPASNTYLQRHAEVVLRDFLTRRAVHTVMYYMDEMHDGPSKIWLSRFESFEQKVKANQFRDGDTFIDRMLRAQPEKGTLKVGHPRFSRTFTFTIEPNRIAKRILQSRGQLSAEWANDLKCIEAENLELQRIGFEKLFCKDDTELDSKRSLIFDSDPFSTDHTPLRFKNYQALKTLTTLHAAARLIPYLRDRGPNHEYMYLLQFVKSYGPIKDGDLFIRTLMERPIETRTNPSHIIHPRAIALQIMELRVVIAKEWKSVMEFIPEEQSLSARRSLERSINLSSAPENRRKRKLDEEDSEPETDS